MIANRLISSATGVHLHDYGCSLKVFRAEVVKPLKLYGEMHRFLPAIASEQGVAHRRGGRQPSRAQARHVEVRHRPDDPRDPRSADGEVPAQLLDAAAADLRADRLRDGPGSALLITRLAGATCGCVGHAVADRQPAAAAARHPADLHRRPARHARPARRAAGAHLPRVAEQADLRDPRDPVIQRADDRVMANG